MNHELYMQRALELARKGLRAVSPNPMVGCVIVHDEKIIGEGWHQRFGGHHAEVNAVESVEDKYLLNETTVYVTLEPCSYHGKTPACSDLLIRNKVKKVVVASLDPNPKVSGAGVQALKEAGIEILSGVCEDESIALNRRFFINQKLKRPYVLLKWAQTQDGFLARSNYDSKWISNALSRQRVHQWRAEEDAILVGKNTVVHDNPSLTVRDWEGRNPIRIVLDRNLELRPDSKLFDGEVKTLVYNTKESLVGNGFERVQINNEDFLDAVLKDMFARDIGSVLVEGGSQVLNSFIEEGLWDEARVFTSEQQFENGIEAPKLDEPLQEVEQIETDELAFYFNSKTKELWQKNYI